MSRRIFYAIWGITLSLLLLSGAMITVTFYNYFTREQFDQLDNEIKLVTQGVSLNGATYFEQLNTNDFRITWMTSEGEILYDNEADTGTMENHLAREEIQDAIQKGYGRSTRYSHTLSMKQLYVANVMSDGTVVRLAISQASLFHLFTHYLWPVSAMILITMGMSFYVASKISAKIVEPLNTLDFDDPMKNADNPNYAEIKPLLQRLEDQQKEIQEHQDILEKTALIRQEFTANASHELRSPLQVISGYAELLENGIVAQEDVPAIAGKIHQEASRLTQLSQDIIELTSLDGGAGLILEDVNLTDVVNHTVQSLNFAAKQAHVTLTCQLENATIKGISNVLDSLVYNLVSNAIKYTIHDDTVLISVKNEEDGVTLSVEDHGIGIPEDDIDRIFERFYRVDKSRSKSVGGTGLGLSIVKHAAMIHHATITVQSTLHKGSTFIVKFPH